MKRFKLFLRSNQIYFDTIAATLLSVMAIILAWNANDIAVKQSKLMAQQMVIEEKRLEREERLEKYQQTKEWTALRDAIWVFWDVFSGKPFASYRNLPISFFVEAFNKIRMILDSQSSNPILINDEESLKNWREAIGSVEASQNILKTLVNIEEPLKDEYRDVLIGSITIINSKVANVWIKLILNSKEVAAVG